MPESIAAPGWDGLDADSKAFYIHVLESLSAAGVPFLVGGAFAFAHFTGIERDTKDLDLFIRREDWARIEPIMRGAGYDCTLAYPHWLAKVFCGDAFIDLIFNSGNGVSPVDEGWFRHADDAVVVGVPVKVCPAEETLWSKAFIMERERYDGADVAHLLRERAERMDWPRLLHRFGMHWRVLLSHLVLFGFIYPGERARIPPWVTQHLLDRLRQETVQAPPDSEVCAGTLLSREQYLHDTQQQGYVDGRLTGSSTMTEEDVAHWTGAIPARPSGAPDGR